MSAVIFVGPTVAVDQARALLDADYRPPAAEGDVFRAARSHPQAIGIIDGYFDRMPAVWHKEILWAMSQGIHVFGSASMGALRAAELAAFGMEGVGRIFEAYRDGAIEDDDEVAVVHEPAEYGFRAGSEAMVDIRHTLNLATTAGVVSRELADALAALAKSQFYPERSFASILRLGAAQGLSAEGLEALRRWLPSGRTSLKRADALAMLGVIRDRIAAGLEPKRVRYTFENSAMWESAWRFAGESDRSETVLLSMVLEELRLEGEHYGRVQQDALLRSLAIKHSYVQGVSEIATQRAGAEATFWRDRDVASAEARLSWMRANGMDEAHTKAFMDDHARVDWIKKLAAFEANGYMLDQLRVSGDYARLVARALAKQATLTDPVDPGLETTELMKWYFEGRLGRAVPADIDDYARQHGFENLPAFQDALAREFSFVSGAQVVAGTGS
jgi:hypothetical protein